MNENTDGSLNRMDAAAVVAALSFPTFVTLVYFVWTAGLDASIQQTAYGLGKTLQFGFPLVWVLGIQRQRVKLLPAGIRGLAEGLGFGILIFAAMLVLYYTWLKPQGYFDPAVGSIQTKVTGMGIDKPWKYALLGLFYAGGHSLLEEYYWRWFVFTQLRRLMRLWPAIMVSSLGFMAHHVIVLATFFGWNSFCTVFFSLSVAIGGGVWAWLYQKRGSLYGPWLSHLVVDAGIFLIGYDIVSELLEV